MAEETYHTDDDDTAAGAAADPKKQPSELADAALYLKMKKLFLLDDGKQKEWREQAKKDFDFIAGDQWEEKTGQAMRDEGRVPLTFNYAAKFVEVVAGLEVGNRHETVYLPEVVEEGDIVANETLSATSDWMAEQCDAEDEQAGAYNDAIICGMGWTESRMDYEADKDGKYIEEQIDPTEMRWDYAAKKKNLADARRVWRVRTLTLDEARELFPDHDESDLSCPWAIGFDVPTEPKSIEERRLKLENSGANDPESEVHIVQVQWIERECYYRVIVNGAEAELTEAEFKQAAKLAKKHKTQLQYAKQFRRVYKQAFIGGRILEVGPCPDPDRFTLQCITGKRHMNKGTWFGLVSLMRSPQMNANKWLSQGLHILNTTAKGGILAEKGVFRDIHDARRTYANPQAITEVADGAIQKGRVMAKPGAGLAAPYLQLQQFAVQAIPDVLGISLELLGMVDRNQPGILEAQRKQAGMTILATLFDALRAYRKEIGRVRMTFIQRYLPDQKLMRMRGKDGYKAIRLIKDDRTMAKHDVIVSDAPSSADQKEKTWNMLMQLSQLESFQSIMTPEAAMEALEYCPLPSKIVSILKKGLAEPKPEQQKQQQLAEAAAMADIQAKQAKAAKDATAAGLDRAKAVVAMADAAIKQMQAQREALINQLNQLGIGPDVNLPKPQPAGDYAVEPDTQSPQLPTLPMLPARAGNTGTMADLMVN